MQSRCGGIEDDMRIVAPGDAAPIAGKDAGGYLGARKRSLIAAEGSSPSRAGRITR
jgi:hypothetical protein